jgi:hypothetical protein
MECGNKWSHHAEKNMIRCKKCKAEITIEEIFNLLIDKISGRK